VQTPACAATYRTDRSGRPIWPPPCA